MISRDDYKNINEQLEIFIYCDEPLYEEDLIFDRRFCDMLYENNYTNHGYFTGNSVSKTKTRVGLEKTKEIVLNFFESISPIYRQKLETALEDGTIEFKKRNSEECSYFEFESDEKSTVVYLNNGIKDVFDLVHEFMHYLNSNNEVFTVVTKFYTESFSTFIELLVCDYIVENYSKYAKDALKMRRDLFESLYQNNIKLKFILNFIDIKINGKDINSFAIAKTLSLFDYNKIPMELVLDLFSEFIEEIKEDVEESYSKYIGYTVGMVLGCKMYDIAKNKKQTREIFDISDNLYKFYADQVLAILDLECKEGLNLDEKGYEELEKIYVNLLKKLW